MSGSCTRTCSQARRDLRPATVSAWGSSARPLGGLACATVPEAFMLHQLLLTTALFLGQAPPAPPDTTAPPPATPSAPAPDRWLLMQSLQGTWPGSLLDGNRLQIYGW